MTSPLILSIDQGTTNTKIALYEAQTGNIVAKASHPVSVSYPAAGWVEQSAEAIWESVRRGCSLVLNNGFAGEIAAVSISNQRETIVVWDAQTGQPIAPAISWQCRRTERAFGGLQAHAGEIEARTGLGLDPLFPAAKLAWLLDNVPEARKRAEAGELRAGTIDSWLLWQLTGGAVHATDSSNAARTQLFDITKLAFDATLLDLFGIPSSLLPAVLPSDARFGQTGNDELPCGIPVHAILGDSHASLLGHGFTKPGNAKVTLGTGSSIMAVTARQIQSHQGLSTTIAWSRGEGVLYALEGNVAVSGHAAAFAAQILGLGGPEQLSALASTIQDSDGVVFIPALAGLGAPRWDTNARGLFAGMSLGTGPAQLARAVIEGMAMQVADLVFAMDADLGGKMPSLSVDGGAAGEDLLVQKLADAIGRPVLRPMELGLSARGAAQLAAMASGLAIEQWRPPQVTSFEPKIGRKQRSEWRDQWETAIRAAKMIGD